MEPNDTCSTSGKVTKDFDKMVNKSENNRNLLIFINPHSGRGKSISVFRKKIMPFLKSNGIKNEVFITDSSYRVSDYIRETSLTELLKFSAIVVVSGDGLLYETINALLSRADWDKAINVPLGIVPTGSGNGLAYTLIKQRHRDIKDFDEAIRICLEQLARDQISEADLVKITFGPGKTVWSFLSIGWGLLSDIDIDSEWLRSLGEHRFTIYGLLRSLTSRSLKGRLSYMLPSVEGEENNGNNEIVDAKTMHNTAGGSCIEIEDEFACLYAVHQSHVSRVTNFAPRSTLTDNLIYLTYIRGKISPCQVIEFLLAIEDGSHEKLQYVKVVPVERFSFQPLEVSKVVVDGEVIQWNLDDGPLTAEVVPRLLKLAWGTPM